MTKIGQKLLQQSIESYVYAVLGAQAKTRWMVYRRRRSEIFTNPRSVSHDRERDHSTKRCDNHYLKYKNSYSKHKRRFDYMAISPGMILVPSNLIVQKEKIPGYNNVLTLATDKMKFGKNTDVNYKAPILTTTTQASPKISQVTPKTTQASPKTTQVTPKTTQANKPKTPSVSHLRF